MMAIVIMAIALICAVGWLTCWVAAAGLVVYLREKGYTPPSDTEIKACIRMAIQEKFWSK